MARAETDTTKASRLRPVLVAVAVILSLPAIGVAAVAAATAVDATQVSAASAVECGPAQTLAADADSWIDQGSPATNKGTDSILKVQSKAPGLNMRALVRFPLPAPPTGCVLESATLRLYAPSAIPGRTLQALQLAGSWTENAVTWDSQPPTTGTAATAASGTGYRAWSVTSQVQAMYTAGSHGFLIRDAGEDGLGYEQQLHSREKGESTPELVLQFVDPSGPPPPPTDTTPPETVLTQMPPDPSGPDVSFAFTGSDNVTAPSQLRFECRLDSTDPLAWTPCASPQPYLELEPELHFFEVRAFDEAGNVDASPAGYFWLVGLVGGIGAPETAITRGPASNTSDTFASFEFTGSDDVDPPELLEFECRLDSQDELAWAECESPIGYGGLAVGTHTFQVRAIDTLENIDPTPASYTWTIAPAGSCGAGQLLSAEADSWVEQSGPLANKGADSVLKVQSKGPSQNMRALVRFPLPALPAGCAVESATLRLYAASAAPGRTLQALRLAGSWTESGVTWSNQPATSGAAASTPANLGYREWNVVSQVQAMYTSGNQGFLIRDASEDGLGYEQQLHSKEKLVSMPELIVRFTSTGPPADTTPPETVITQLPPDPSGLDVSFAFTGSDNVTAPSQLRFQCRLDSAAFASCSSPVGYAGLSAGSHSFQVRAIDEAGNTDASPAGYTWTVSPPPADTTPPETTIIQQPVDPSGASVSFAFTGSDNVTSVLLLRFECKLDSAAFTTCLSPVSYTGLSAGTHSFQVRAIDEAGNVDPSPAAYSWTVSPSTPACTTSTVAANADSWIDRGFQSGNFGGDTLLNVRSRGGARVDAARTLVRFPLPPVAAGCVLQSATLRLYAASATPGQTLEAWRLGGSWLEDAVTWDTQPATTGAAATTTSATGYREWTMTSQVRAMYLGSNDGFLIKDATENHGGAVQQFHSWEYGENPPQLVLRFVQATS